MTPQNILGLNGWATTGCAVVLLALRQSLPREFGLSGPMVTDMLAVGLFVYAVALLSTARRRSVSRTALLAFTAGDVAWVVGSAVVLLVAWEGMSATGRVLVVAVALAVELFAALQYRAAWRLAAGRG